MNDGSRRDRLDETEKPELVELSADAASSLP